MKYTCFGTYIITEILFRSHLVIYHRAFFTVNIFVSTRHAVHRGCKAVPMKTRKISENF